MEEDYKKLDIYNYWKDSELHSTKGNTFFNTYDELFSKYRNKKIIFINYRKFLIDDLNGRVTKKLKDRIIGGSKKNSLNKSIYFIKYFTNFVAFFIDRKKVLKLNCS